MVRLPIGRIVQMLGVQAISALGPFLVLPVIARGSTTEEWSSFVLGQSFGLMLASVSSYGWAVVGITRVARARREDRPAIFVESLVTRFVTVLTFGSVGIAILVYVVKPASLLTAVSVCLGFLLYTGFAMNWYYVGVGKPWQNLVYGTVPLLAAGLVTILVIWLGGSAGYYGPVLVVAGLIAMSCALIFDIKPAVSDWTVSANPRRVGGYFRSEFSVFLSQSVMAIYLTLPMAFASSGLAVSDSARYATADRLNTLATTGIGTVGKVMQGWRSESYGLSRAHISAGVTVVLGLLGGGFLVFFGEWFTGALFGAHVSVPPALCLFLGLFAFLVSVRYSLLRYYLVPSGAYRATLIGAVVSFSSLFFMLVVMHENLRLETIGIALCSAELLGIVALTCLAIVGGRTQAPQP